MTPGLGDRLTGQTWPELGCLFPRHESDCTLLASAQHDDDNGGGCGGDDDARLYPLSFHKAPHILIGICS